MKTQLRKQINRALHAAIPSFAPSIPVGKILEIVETAGFTAVCEDGSPFSAIFCGHCGSCSIQIVEKETGKLQKEAIQLQWWGDREHGCKGKIETNVYVM